MPGQQCTVGKNVYVTLDWICLGSERISDQLGMAYKTIKPFLFCRIICYLTGILLAFLVLIGVIVVLTLMVANKELGIIKEIDF